MSDSESWLSSDSNQYVINESENSDSNKDGVKGGENDRIMSIEP